MMSKVAILTEKPSQAKAYAIALGGKSGTFDGVTYRIVNARGHLYALPSDVSTLVSPELAGKYKSWDTANLPWNKDDINWDKKPISDTSKERKAIKDAFTWADTICIATDVDPTGEGQLLAWECIVGSKIGNTKKFVRSWHLDETPNSIKKAFKERTVLEYLDGDPEYAKSFFRNRWDYMSMPWTRVATNNGSGEYLLRVGRLKTPMVVLVGDQLDAIANYVKKPFFENRFKDELGNVFTKKENDRFDTEAEVPTNFTTSGIEITSVKVLKKSAPTPKLFTNVQSLLEAKGISAAVYEKTYQKMYEDQVLTYPRTEDKKLTVEQFTKDLTFIDSVAKCIGLDPKYLVNKKPRKKYVSKGGGAHGVNRPGEMVPSSLAEVENKYGKVGKAIYSTFAKSYLAIFMADYEYEKTDAIVTKYPDYKSSVNVPKKLGYKAIFKGMGEDDDDGEASETKGFGSVATPFVHEGANKKPETPTSKWLYKQLEKYNVGTPATQVSTYKEVTRKDSPKAKRKSQLLVAKAGKLQLAPAGEEVYIITKGTNIASLELTGRVVNQMEQIKKGELDPETALSEVAGLLMEDIPVMESNGESIERTYGAKSKPKHVGVWNGAECSFNKTRMFRTGEYTFTDSEAAKLFAGETITIKVGNIEVIGKLEKQVYEGYSYVGFKEDVKAMKENEGSKDPAYYYYEVDGEQRKFKKAWGKQGKVFTDKECRDLVKGKEISFMVGKYETKGTLEQGKFKGSNGKMITYYGFMSDYQKQMNAKKK